MLRSNNGFAVLARWPVAGKGPTQSIPSKFYISCRVTSGGKGPVKPIPSKFCSSRKVARGRKGSDAVNHLCSAHEHSKPPVSQWLYISCYKIWNKLFPNKSMEEQPGLECELIGKSRERSHGF
jgi:hypothetical protein